MGKKASKEAEKNSARAKARYTALKASGGAILKTELGPQAANALKLLTGPPQDKVTVRQVVERALITAVGGAATLTDLISTAHES